MSTLEALERAHRLSASANGMLSLAIERRKMNPHTAERCVREWRAAADTLEKIFLKEES